LQLQFAVFMKVSAYFLTPLLSINWYLTIQLGDHGPVLREIITEHMLPLASRTDDRWLASLAFWMIDKTDEAVAVTMVINEISHCDKKLMLICTPFPDTPAKAYRSRRQITIHTFAISS
jgi:hypothetical protein